MMKPKARLDELIVRQGLAKDLAEARAIVMEGKVSVAGEKITKPGTSLPEASEIVIASGEKYVSRGGLKLETALDEFAISPAGKICLDVGSSTGGFTDLLLQRGAQKVYAVDVGKGLIDWKLRNDPRVALIEDFNARFISPQVIPEKVALAAIDVSFISLKLILPPLKSVLAPGAEVLAMVKPQFELEAKFLQKGVAKKEEDQLRAVTGISDFAQQTGFKVLGTAKSKIKGPKGNQEYFLHLKI